MLVAIAGTVSFISKTARPNTQRDLGRFVEAPSLKSGYIAFFFRGCASPVFGSLPPPLGESVSNEPELQVQMMPGGSCAGGEGHNSSHQRTTTTPTPQQNIQGWPGPGCRVSGLHPKGKRDGLRDHPAGDGEAEPGPVPGHVYSVSCLLRMEGTWEAKGAAKLQPERIHAEQKQQSLRAQSWFLGLQRSLNNNPLARPLPPAA